jgi:hypothetical protein
MASPANVIFGSVWSRKFKPTNSLKEITMAFIRELLSLIRVKARETFPKGLKLSFIGQEICDLEFYNFISSGGSHFETLENLAAWLSNLINNKETTKKHEKPDLIKLKEILADKNLFCKVKFDVENSCLSLMFMPNMKTLLASTCVQNFKNVLLALLEIAGSSGVFFVWKPKDSFNIGVLRKASNALMNEEGRERWCKVTLADDSSELVNIDIAPCEDHEYMETTDNDVQHKIAEMKARETDADAGDDADAVAGAGAGDGAGADGADDADDGADDADDGSTDWGTAVDSYDGIDESKTETSPVPQAVHATKAISAPQAVHATKAVSAPQAVHATKAVKLLPGGMYGPGIDGVDGKPFYAPLPPGARVSPPLPPASCVSPPLPMEMPYMQTGPCMTTCTLVFLNGQQVWLPSVPTPSKPMAGQWY